MKNLLTLLAVVVMMTACATTTIKDKYVVQSPDKKTEIKFQLTPDGTPEYQVFFNGNIIIDKSNLGFDFKEQDDFIKGFVITNAKTGSYKETWEMQWGEQRLVDNEYNELIVELTEKESLKRKMNLHFKVYDDGVGFRYEIPEQENLQSVKIDDELTQFNLTADHLTWWIPGDWDIYEHLYKTSKLSKIKATKTDPNSLAQTYIPYNAVNTPVTMKTNHGIHISFHEANLTDYPGMTLMVDTVNLDLNSELVGSDRLGYKADKELPFVTPWRTIQISENAGGLIESNLIVNLNEPNKLGDISHYFKPMKYTGIWWEYHVDKSRWDYTYEKDYGDYSNVEPHGRHGATTENAKAFIDFSAANNIDGVLIEGWNTGWEKWVGFEDREGVFDFITPYPDYDFDEVIRYAKEKGIQIIMHHETSAAPRTYEQQVDTAFAFMKKWNINSVKTGYVGKVIPKGEYHHGQWMVNHYRKILKKGADYEIAINAHEPIKATGLRRTYPNAIAREGLRGQEFNAWSQDGGNPPEHLPIVAFTRMLSGPIDFTPGVFNIKLDPYKPNNQVNTTIAQQLALYVVINSPLQMACDLIENYENNPAFNFIRDVGVNWEQTKVLSGEVGDFVCMAREERVSKNWFVGAITDENARSIEIDFSFLDKDTTYEVIVYQDGKDAHWDNNPTSIDIQKMEIDHTTVKTFELAAGGGLAISLIKKQ